MNIQARQKWKVWSLTIWLHHQQPPLSDKCRHLHVNERKATHIKQQVTVRRTGKWQDDKEEAGIICCARPCWIIPHQWRPRWAPTNYPVDGRVPLGWFREACAEPPVHSAPKDSSCQQQTPSVFFKSYLLKCRVRFLVVLSHGWRVLQTTEDASPPTGTWSAGSSVLQVELGTGRG